MNKVGYQDNVKTLTQIIGHRERGHNIGLLGGTFNPVHTGHLIIADQVRSQLGLDQVLLMPDAIPPHVDRKHAIDASHRVNMLRLATEDNAKLGLELSEILRGGKSFSYDTIKELTHRFPNNNYYFIIGGDMVEYLPKWYRINDLIKMVQFVAVRRNGYPFTSKYPVVWVDVPMIDVSSTLIRSKLHQVQSIRYLVPTAVDNYIKENHLYE
ncbi:nicotinate-nucleotide adenylyltransferase [Nicoliella spurrieriana]|uniref:Probable nicotinate-nucleotide adenylyltransferase n=1 Tax=Nicoliella spurrieriana TaxID=2925830 RepID=A0A976X5H0_9LACO|nr:nicotinate-nucleotide adenylyltransferase [Nicoliella spurrieriana]UQS86701.1 nicotinate-nucleotide adenylyltransferase [Nicoliella spurrieriana]